MSYFNFQYVIFVIYLYIGTYTILKKLLKSKHKSMILTYYDTFLFYFGQQYLKKKGKFVFNYIIGFILTFLMEHIYKSIPWQ